MNRWQQYLIDHEYGGRMPRSKDGKLRVSLLEHVEDEVIVDFPDLEGLHGPIPAHRERFVVTEDECDMPHGKISVRVLASNLKLWFERGYNVLTKKIYKGEA